MYNKKSRTGQLSGSVMLQNPESYTFLLCHPYYVLLSLSPLMVTRWLLY